MPQAFRHTGLTTSVSTYLQRGTRGAQGPGKWFSGGLRVRVSIGPKRSGHWQLAFSPVECTVQSSTVNQPRQQPPQLLKVASTTACVVSYCSPVGRQQRAVEDYQQITPLRLAQRRPLSGKWLPHSGGMAMASGPRERSSVICAAFACALLCLLQRCVAVNLPTAWRTGIATQYGGRQDGMASTFRNTSCS